MMNYKTIETDNDGKKTTFAATITELDSDTTSFTIFNDCADKWIWQLMRHNGTEHHMEEVAAVGLVFNKTSSKTMAEVLRHIANKLEECNTK